MSYTVVNEELQIYSCSVSDLTMRQAESFLEQWGDGVKLGNLTMFYEKESGALVINRDCDHYELYLDLAEVLLGTVVDLEKGRELLKGFPYSTRETVEVLKNCRQSRKVAKELKILSHQVSGVLGNTFEQKVLKRIVERNGDAKALSMYEAYIYGVMQGKRAERKRRLRTVRAK